jgi:hypothetical protein
MLTVTQQIVLGMAINFASSFAAVVFAYLLGRLFFDRRYADWHVRVVKDGIEKVNRPVSPRMAREINEEPGDLSVFLKGVASPYGYIRCDILEEGRDRGLLEATEERYGRFRWRIRRTYTIDMDKNPKAPSEPPCALARFPTSPATANVPAASNGCPIADYLHARPQSGPTPESTTVPRGL